MYDNTYMKYGPELPPYPVAEHLATPSTPAEWIAEELRTGGVGERLRVCIRDGLGSIYHGTNLARSLYVDSKTLAPNYAVIGGPELTLSFRSEVFYSGALLGMHAGLGGVESTKRQTMLGLWHGDKAAFDDDQTEYLQNKSVLMQGALSDCFQRLDQYPDELRDVIIEASVSSFSDKEDTMVALGYGQTMMFGTVYAMHAVEKAKRAVAARSAR